MLQKLLDRWVLIFMAGLTALFAVAYWQQAPVAAVLVDRIYGLPSWFIVMGMLVVTIILACLFLPWYWRAASLIFVILFSFAVPGAYLQSGLPLVTGLIAAHLYGGLAITFLLQILVARDNERARKERKEAWEEIHAEKSLLADVKNGQTNGTEHPITS